MYFISYNLAKVNNQLSVINYQDIDLIIGNCSLVLPKRRNNISISSQLISAILEITNQQDLPK